MNDFWCLNVEKSPFTWFRFETKSEMPSPRVYHSAALCQTGTATGMIVVYGGRGADQVATNDAWGLRRHRNGTWDWVKAPSKSDKLKPAPRYQHSSAFIGSVMVVIGGRTNSPTEAVGIETYDTETSEWTKIPGMLRFRHTSWLLENYLYIFGGFEHDSPNIPTDSLAKINLLSAFQSNEKLLGKIQPLSPKLVSSNNVSPTLSPIASTNASLNSSLMSSKMQIESAPTSNNKQNSENFGYGMNNNMTLLPSKLHDYANKSNKMEIVYPLQNSFKLNTPQIMPINTMKPSNRMVIEDSKGSFLQSTQFGQHKYLKMTQQEAAISGMFLSQLLQPKNMMYLDPNAPFPFKSQLILALCDQAQAIIEQQPMVLRLRSPIKIFGDIHGQYSDLMRFFDLWGSPCDGPNDGDIESFDYLFLGDFVDRGSHSLETICLLLALKVKYPDQIHLIRGNHEDKWINNGFGFSDECINRIGGDPNEADEVFNRINVLFEYLPLAAVIDEKVLCLHGGIGSTLEYVEQIETLKRPLEVIHEVATPEQQLVVDILWSDPTENDDELGIIANEMRDPGRTGNIVKFGPDVVQQFLQRNNLNLIIRAHECVMDGFERFAGGQLITVFSATDYCRRHKNAGAVLILKKNSEIIPKMIYPETANQVNWIEDEEALKKRPPTPPRWKNTAPRKSSFD